MKQWQRVFIYLILNVLVSACTTFAVLIIWDRTHGPMPGGLIPLSLSLPVRATPTALEPIGAPLPEATPTRTFIAYQVKDGDTFDSIAKDFGITPEELMAENGFNTNTPVGAGEVLRVPVLPQRMPAASVKIESIIGAGDLTSEHVFLKQDGAGEVQLEGWKLENGNNTYIFPQLTLFGGAVNVWTKSGVNTVVDLYWDQDNPAWKSGEQVTLLDSQGNVKDTYSIP